ncbi:MAG: hypothetical protein WCJ37_11295, partial [Syntrophus sp. (in: bacteria)]
MPEFGSPFSARFILKPAEQAQSGSLQLVAELFRRTDYAQEKDKMHAKRVKLVGALKAVVLSKILIFQFHKHAVSLTPTANKNETQKIKELLC